MHQQLFTSAGYGSPDSDSRISRVPLFGDFFKSNSLAYLSSSSPFHRSALAVQLGHAWSVGYPLLGIPMSPLRRRVLYIDGHRTPEEFNACYIDPVTGAGFPFEESFVHASFLHDFLLPDSWSSSFEIKFTDQLKNLVEMHNPNIVIIDSADWLLSLGCSLKDINRLMWLARDWIRLKGLSVLFLISPVDESPGSSWSQNRHLKLFLRQSPSIFSLCRSRLGPHLFYLRDDKANKLSGKVSPDVLLTSVSYQDCHWKFTLHDHVPEFLHAMNRPRNISLTRREMALQLRIAGYTLRQIADYLGVSRNAVHKMLKNSTLTQPAVNRVDTKVDSILAHN